MKLAIFNPKFKFLSEFSSPAKWSTEPKDALLFDSEHLEGDEDHGVEVDGIPSCIYVNIDNFRTIDAQQFMEEFWDAMMATPKPSIVEQAATIVSGRSCSFNSGVDKYSFSGADTFSFDGVDVDRDEVPIVLQSVPFDASKLADAINLMSKVLYWPAEDQYDGFHTSPAPDLEHYLCQMKKMIECMRQITDFHMSIDGRDNKDNQYTLMVEAIRRVDFVLSGAEASDMMLIREM